MRALRHRWFVVGAAASALLPATWAVIWGSGVDTALLLAVFFLAMVCELILGVWRLATVVRELGHRTSREIEKARARLDWRSTYEVGTLYRSLKKLLESMQESQASLAESLRGARLQGDKSARALKATTTMLDRQQEQIAGLQGLVVELVARADGLEAPWSSDEAAP